MPWFKQDDGFYRHPKVRKMAPGKMADKVYAVGVWDLCGTWCADNVLTNTADGFVPDSVLEQWDPRHKGAKLLVVADLWERVEVDGESGYLFHDWADYNPTRASVEAEREAWRERQARSRKKKSQDESRVTDAGLTDAVTDGVTGQSQSPVPVPVPSSGSGRGEGYVPARASSPPTEQASGEERPPGRPAAQCPKHLGDPDGPSCLDCRDARLAAEAWDRSQAGRHRRAAELAAEAERQRAAEIRQQAIDACGDCDGDGYAGRQVCPHDGGAAAKAATRGSAAVRAALAKREAS